MAYREKQTLAEKRSIAEHTRQRLHQLEVEYRIPDKIKKTSGYIALTSIGCIVTLVFLNDFINGNIFLKVFERFG